MGTLPPLAIAYIILLSLRILVDVGVAPACIAFLGDVFGVCGSAVASGRPGTAIVSFHLPLPALLVGFLFPRRFCRSLLREHIDLGLAPG